MDRGVFDALPDIKDVIDDVPAIVTPPPKMWNAKFYHFYYTPFDCMFRKVKCVTIKLLVGANP